MSGPESQQPLDPVEAPKPEGAAPEKVEKPLDEMAKEHDAKHAEQEQRDAEEKPEHKEEEQTAESVLDKEINAEMFEEMANALTGDAKEVFETIRGQLTPEERADIGAIMSEFHDFSEKNDAEMHEKTGQGSKEEFLAAGRANRGRIMASTFQNSIDGAILAAQNIKPEGAKTEEGKYAEEMNERNNQQFKPTKGDATWNKMRDLVEGKVKELKEKDPSRVFKTRERKEGQGGSGGREGYELGRVTDLITAETLMTEVGDMKRDGVTAVLKDSDGKTELTDLQNLSAQKQVQLELGVPKGMDAAVIEKAMQAEGATRTVNLGDRQVFTGSPKQIREGLQRVARQAEKAQSTDKKA